MAKHVRFTPLLILVCAAMAQAQTERSPLEAAWIQAGEFLPSAVPDRIILNLTETPARSMAVTWRTDISVTSALAQIAVAAGTPDFRNRAQVQPAVTELISHLGIRSAHHHVVFEDLAPSTPYAYRVGEGHRWSEWFHFQTAADEPAPFTFLYFGDAQNEIKSMWSRVVRQAFTEMPKAAFFLHAGDLVNQYDSDREWGEWFHAAGWLNGSVPSLMTPGNHEYSWLTLSPQWRPHFTLPKNGPPSFALLEETVYSVDYQGVRFLCLDSPALGPLTMAVQREWLKERLQNNPNRWTIVFHHHPVHQASANRSDHFWLNLGIKDLYEEYAVDLVLQGHDHSYARGRNRSLGGRWMNRRSPVYVVSVSGPKMYEVGTNWAEVEIGNTQLYQLITVDGSVLHFEAFDAVGNLVDAFSLVKSASGGSDLIPPPTR
jgi:3',5'-cyclic AMP phosphodiesterase CpdA